MAGVIQIIKPRNKDDVRALVEMYYQQNDFTFLPASLEEAYRSLFGAVRANRFVRMALRDSEILGFIYADISKSTHMIEKMYQQLYYTSNQKGLLAARLVVLLHEALIEEAKLKKINLVVSAGSHMDEDCVMARILEKNGWKRKGYLAVYKIDEASAVRDQTVP